MHGLGGWSEGEWEERHGGREMLQTKGMPSSCRPRSLSQRSSHTCPLNGPIDALAGIICCIYDYMRNAFRLFITDLPHYYRFIRHIFFCICVLYGCTSSILGSIHSAKKIIELRIVECICVGG